MQVLEMPYAGEDLVDGRAAARRRWTASPTLEKSADRRASWPAGSRGCASEQVTVGLPRFKVTSEFST